MFNFEQLVESLLLEGHADDFLNIVKTKISSVEANILTQIFQLVQKGQKSYISGETWAPYTEYTPLFSAVINALHSSGTIAEVRKLGLQNEDDFYGKILTVYNDASNTDHPRVKALIDNIKPFTALSTQERAALAKDVKDIHNTAEKKNANQVLIQNVWPSIQNLTIVDAVTTLLTKRLTNLEALKLKFLVPLNTLKAPMIDGIMKDVLYNLQAYSSGSKKYSADVVEVLKNINIVPEDFAKVATHTVNLYKQLVTDSAGQDADTALKEITNDNIYNFAKTGTFTYTLNKQARTNTADKYTLDFIQSLHIVPGDDLIKQIESMSSGIRVKDKSWQNINLNQALGSLASVGGVGDIYGGVR